MDAGNIAMRYAPFTEIEAKVFIGENIDAGMFVAFHPEDGMLYAVWRGATVAGCAMADLEQGKIAVFNPHVGQFKPEPGPVVYTCQDCKDGTDDDFMMKHNVCPACGSDWIPF